MHNSSVISKNTLQDTSAIEKSVLSKRVEHEILNLRKLADLVIQVNHVDDHLSLVFRGDHDTVFQNCVLTLILHNF